MTAVLEFVTQEISGEQDYRWCSRRWYFNVRIKYRINQDTYPGVNNFSISLGTTGSLYFFNTQQGFVRQEIDELSREKTNNVVSEQV